MRCMSKRRVTVYLDEAVIERGMALAWYERRSGVSIVIEELLSERTAALPAEVLEEYRASQAPRDGVSVPVPEPAVKPPSRSRKPKDDRPRCPHQGVRVTGGWCPKCDSEVEPGGALKA